MLPPRPKVSGKTHATRDRLGKDVASDGSELDGARPRNLHGFVVGTNARTPNDPKLSDRGGWRAGCMVGGKAAAEAGAVMCGAVRCSAWLGVRLDSEETWNKSLETVALAGNDRVTGDEKLAHAERMEVRTDQSRRSVEARGMTGDEKAKLTGVAAEPRGSDAELATDAEREACAGEAARNSEQAGKRRGIGKLGVGWRSSWESCGFVLGVTARERLTTPSSATGGRGAQAARRVERWRRCPSQTA